MWVAWDAMRLLPALSLLSLIPAVLLACPRTGDDTPPTSTRTGDEALDGAARVAAALPRFLEPETTRQETDPPAMDRAMPLVMQQQYTEARAILERIVADDPGHGRATFLLGFTHHKEKRYSEARPYLERALEIGPTYDEATAVFYIYAWCLWYLGEPDGAKAAFEAMLGLKPDERDAWFGLGLIAVDAADADEGERCFEKSIALSQAYLAARPDDPRAAAQIRRDIAKAEAGLGDVAMLRGDYEAARRRFESCVQQLPTAYEAWFRLHRVCARLGDTIAAEQALRMHNEAKRRLGR